MIRPLSDLTGQMYRSVGKPMLFLFPADTVHHTMVKMGERMTHTPLQSLFSTIYSFEHPVLDQTLDGIRFQTPSGLAAGFDYDVQLPEILPSIGFGWSTVGTITYEPYQGNPPPMLGRLPHSRSLWVNKGFKSAGAVALKEKIARLRVERPLGISVGATNRPYESENEQITEYIKAFETLGNNLPNTHWELNISCPNLAAGNDFQKPPALARLLQQIDTLALPKPVYLKMPVDVTLAELVELLKVVERSSLRGIILGNLTKTADQRQFWLSERQRFKKGGFSGQPTARRSDFLIRAAHAYFQGSHTIIGCGGIFSAADAYRKIRQGANLLQFITGLIYQGPQLPGQVHADLARQLQADGFTHISQAVGVE